MAAAFFAKARFLCFACGLSLAAGVRLEFDSQAEDLYESAANHSLQLAAGGDDCWTDRIKFETWAPACHDSFGFTVNSQLVTFLAQLSGFTYCDYWDRDAADIEVEDGRTYIYSLREKIQAHWSEVCASLPEDAKKAGMLCNEMSANVGPPVTGKNLLYYFTRFRAPGGRLLLVVTFRGTRLLDCGDWNVDVGDPCPRDMDPDTFLFANAEAAEQGECPGITTDSGFRVIGSMVTAYREQIRAALHADLVKVLTSKLDEKVEIILNGHSLGGGLSQLAGFDLAHSKVLDRFQGRVAVTVTHFMGPRIFGRKAAIATMEKFQAMHEALTGRGGKPIMSELGLGLTWRGMAYMDPEDMVTAWPPSFLIELLETTAVRRIFYMINNIGVGSLPNLICPAQASDLMSAGWKSKFPPSKMFQSDGSVNSPCVKLPRKSITENAWEQFFYMPQPLLTRSNPDSLLLPMAGTFAHHAQATGVKFRDYMMSSLGEDHDIVKLFGTMGGEAGDFIVTLTHGSGGILKTHFCTVALGAVTCDVKGSKATSFRVEGSCSKGSSAATVSISAPRPGGGGWIPCGFNSQGTLRCATEMEPVELGIELLSTGLDKEMAITLFAPARAGKSRRDCGVNCKEGLQCVDAEARSSNFKSGAFRMKVVEVLPIV